MYRLSTIFIMHIFLSMCFTSDCISYELGDINNDNQLNVVDIVSSVDIILTNSYNPEADFNSDNVVNVVDLVTLIERILNPFEIDVNIETIDFDFTELSIKWTQTNNYGFYSYNLYYSNFIDNTIELLTSNTNITDTTFTLNGFILNEQNYFTLSIKDITGCELFTNEKIYELPFKTYELDEFGNSINTQFSTDDFRPSVECSSCHEEHYNEWFSSMHSYTSRSPLFFSYKSETVDNHPQIGEKFCMQCHNPVSFLSNVNTSEYTNVEEFQKSDLSQTIKDGIGCDVCHTITGLSSTVFTGENLAATAEYKMYPLGNIKFGSIQDPEPNEFHASYYLPTYTSSQMCLPCHDLVIKNKEAEITFTEWNRIPGFSMFGGVSCQECHMPIKENGYHSHKFVGVDIDLSIPLDENNLKNDVQDLLETSATIDFIYQDEQIVDTIYPGNTLTIPITVTSNTAHSLPSGTSFNRQAWLELIVTNNNNIIFESGKVINNEQLNFNDSDLLLFRSIILDNEGNISNNVTDIEEINNYSLLAYSKREKYYDILIPSDLRGELFITARLLFRPFDPEFISEHHPEFLDNLPIYEIDTINTKVVIQ